MISSSLSHLRAQVMGKPRIDHYNNAEVLYFYYDDELLLLNCISKCAGCSCSTSSECQSQVPYSRGSCSAKEGECRACNLSLRWFVLFT